MASTYSSNLKTNLMGTGDQSGTWGSTTNFNLGTLMEQAISAYCTQQFNNADITLPLVDGSDAGGNTTPGTIYTTGTAAVPVSARNMYIECQGTSSGNNLIVPNNTKLYYVYNNITSGGGTITVKTSAGTGVAVAVGQRAVLACNGTNVVHAVNSNGGASGTANYVAKFNSTYGLGNSAIYDDGTNVGIGTSSPASKLDVVGTINSQGNATSIVHYQAQDTGGATAEKTWRIAQSQRATKSIQLGIAANDAGSVANAAINIVRSGATLDNIQFATGNGTERMRIDSSGNVGIGTSSPTVKLDIGGSTAFAIQASLTSGADNNFHLYAVNGATGNADGTEVARFGVGYGGNASTSFSSGFSFIRGGNATDGSLAILTSASERMRIDSSGNVGIGTASPSPTSKLTLAGNASTFCLTTPNILEAATVVASPATGTINYDLTTQSVVYYTSNATGNWTLNFRASSGTTLNSALAVGQAVTAVFIAAQGTTAYYNNVLQIDGTTTGVTIKWQGGTPGSGNANGIDSYAYTIIKTGSATYTVLATQSQFY